MKSEEFFKVIGDIDDELIEEAGKFRKNNIRKFIVKWGALAACFAIVTVLSVQVLDRYGSENSDSVIIQGFTQQNEGEKKQDEPVTENPADEGTSGDETAMGGSSTEVIDIQKDDVTTEEDASEESEIVPEAPDKQNGTPEKHRPESGDTSPFWGFNPDDTVTADKIYGGDYIDENGNHIVYITKDTSENRLIIADWLGFSESELVFKSGKYTYKYLKNLYEKISAAMQNGEIPFVISASVMESSNRVAVSVNTNDEAELSKVRALDSIGGAINFEYNLE